MYPIYSIWSCMYRTCIQSAVFDRVSPVRVFNHLFDRVSLVRMFNHLFDRVLCIWLCVYCTYMQSFVWSSVMHLIVYLLYLIGYLLYMYTICCIWSCVYCTCIQSFIWSCNMYSIVFPLYFNIPYTYSIYCTRPYRWLKFTIVILKLMVILNWQTDPKNDFYMTLKAILNFSKITISVKITIIIFKNWKSQFNELFFSPVHAPKRQIGWPSNIFAWCIGSGDIVFERFWFGHSIPHLEYQRKLFRKLEAGARRSLFQVSVKRDLWASSLSFRTVENVTSNGKAVYFCFFPFFLGW